MRLWRYQIHKRDFASIGGKACLARIHATFSIVAAFLDNGIAIGGAVGFFDKYSPHSESSPNSSICLHPLFLASIISIWLQ